GMMPPSRFRRGAFQHVAEATHRCDLDIAALKFLAQAVQYHLDSVGVRVAVLLEHLQIELMLLHWRSGARNQSGQRGMLSRREMQDGAVEGEGLAFGVVEQRPALDAPRGPAAAASH